MNNAYKNASTQLRSGVLLNVCKPQIRKIKTLQTTQSVHKTEFANFHLSEDTSFRFCVLKSCPFISFRGHLQLFVAVATFQRCLDSRFMVFICCVDCKVFTKMQS